MKKSGQFEALIKKDKYQVFLFSCPGTLPFGFARHPWFVVNKKGVISRWEIFWNLNRPKTGWGHLYKDFYPPFQGIEMFPLVYKYFWKDSITLLGTIEGDENSIAKQMAEFIESSPTTYPYCYQYSLSGVNSNSYGQWVLSRFPEANLYLPWKHFGKGKAPRFVQPTP